MTKTSSGISKKGPKISDIHYAGLFDREQGRNVLKSGLSWSYFEQLWQEYARQNLRLISLHIQEHQTNPLFSGVWKESSQAYGLMRVQGIAAFKSLLSSQMKDVRLIDFHIDTYKGQLWYTGVWLGTSIQQEIIYGKTWEQFKNTWRNLTTGNKRLTKIQTYVEAGQVLYAGLFEQGHGKHDLYSTQSGSEFLKRFKRNKISMHLVDLNILDFNGTRTYQGVWREYHHSHKLVYGQDWSSFKTRCQRLSKDKFQLKVIRVYKNTVDVPEPEWASVLKNKLAKSCMGYSYIVSKKGTITDKGQSGLARSFNEAHLPSIPWSTDTLINLASVSKPITAVAFLKLLNDYQVSLDTPFYQYLKDQIPQAGRGVETVTFRHLLNMHSGMIPEGQLWGDIWSFLRNYLRQDLRYPAGQKYQYSNTNFTILQALMDKYTPQKSYSQYVQQVILKPMGIDTNHFTIKVENPDLATLCYAGRSDQRPGQYWHDIDFVSSGGWLASANELIKFLQGVRNHTVLSAHQTEEMFKERLGWYSYDGIFGQYFNHVGELENGLSPTQKLTTAIIRFSNDYDALLLINSPQKDILSVLVEAFEMR